MTHFMFDLLHILYMNYTFIKIMKDSIGSLIYIGDKQTVRDI